MLLTINAIGSDMQIPDPFPTEGSCTVGASAGTSKSFIVSEGQLHRLTPQLKALETKTLGDAGNTPLMTWSVSIGTTADLRSVDGDAPNSPVVTTLAAASIAHGGVSGVILKGKNFLRNQAKAALTLLAGVVYTAVLPGSAGNAITVRYVVAGLSTALSVTVSGNDITVNLATNGSGVPTSTISTVVAAVNGAAAAAALVVASGSGSTVQAAVAKTHLINGQGPGLAVTVGLDTCTITAVTDTQITFTVPALTEGVATNLSVLSVQAGLSYDSMSVPLT